MFSTACRNQMIVVAARVE